MKNLNDMEAIIFKEAKRIIRQIDQELTVLNAAELEHLEEVEFLIENRIPLSDNEFRRLACILYRGKKKMNNH